MADDNHGSGISFEPCFKPDQGVQVQVVGGLVKQQNIRRTHQRPRQLQTHAPAARKTVHRVIQFVNAEPQSQDQRFCARQGVVVTGIGQVGIDMRHFHAVASGFCFNQALA